MTNKYNSIKEIGQYVLYTAILAGTFALCGRAIKENYKSPDFENAQWIEAPGVLASDAYSQEKIIHNQISQMNYYDAVKAKNNGKLEGAVLFPDLDKDGKIGGN